MFFCLPSARLIFTIGDEECRIAQMVKAMWIVLILIATVSRFRFRSAERRPKNHTEQRTVSRELPGEVQMR
jgi:hypothetical protein